MGYFAELKPLYLRKMNTPCLSILIYCFASLSLAANTYTIQILDPITGYIDSNAASLNSHGDVVGISWDGSSKMHATLWTEGRAIGLGTFGGAESYAYAINDDGWVVGFADLPPNSWGSSQYRAFIGNELGLTEIDAAHSGRWSYAFDINSSRLVIGGAFGVGVFSWDGGSATDFQLPDGYDYGRPIAVNDRGEILMEWYSSNGDALASISRGGELELLDFGIPGRTSLWAMNNRGEIVGTVRAEGTLRPFLWTRVNNNEGGEGDEAWEVRYLPIAGTDRTYFYPRSINDEGTIVGHAQNWNHWSTAVMWRDGELFDLNDLTSDGENRHLESATAINNNGQVVGNGQFSGEWRAFLLTASASRMAIRVDTNRDGFIDVEGQTDLTSWERPFRFWLNDDVDRFDPDEDEQDDLNPADHEPDFSDNVINSLRDLEDFTRLRIWTGREEWDPSWMLSLQFVDIVEGDPGINVWPAQALGLTYLQFEEVARAQLALANRHGPLTVNSLEEVVIPSAYFRNPQGTDGMIPLLFEARTEGLAMLQVRLRDGEGRLMAEDAVHMELRPIAAFYDHWTAGDTDTIELHEIPFIPRVVHFASQPPEAEGYILFVHGWRLQPWERRAFAETAYKRLWHQGYRGGFGLFSWPTEWHANRRTDHVFDPQHYNRSERKAYWSAIPLRRLLRTLDNQHPGEVRVLAHSMGNVVVSEALLLEAESPQPRQLLHTYVASQAATVAHAYDATRPTVRSHRVPDHYGRYPGTGAPYYNDVGVAAGMFVNFFNEQDFALTYNFAWPANQRTKPDSGYGYDPRGASFHRRTPRRHVLSWPQDRWEIFAHAAPAHSGALGADGGVGNVVIRAEDLSLLDTPLTNDPRDHSAQFRSFLARRAGYWDVLIERLGL
jgi:probable HAF family extracellular repeat protein